MMITAAVLLGAGCTDQPALFPGIPDRAPRVVLPAGEIALYEEDSIVLEVSGDGGVRAQLLILDDAGAVAWRSQEASVQGTVAAVEVSGLGNSVPRGAVMRLTAAVMTSDGERYYASDDTLAVRTLSQSATRALRVYSGRRVRVWSGGQVAADMVGAPDLGVAYYASPAEGRIGILDLNGPGRLLAGTAATTPARLAYAGGIVAAMSADGGELAFMRALPDGLQPLRRTLLPALEIEADTSFLAAARPAGWALGFACAPGCDTPVAVVTSGLVPLKGAAGPAPGVVRLIPALDSETPQRVVLPAYEAAVRGDSAIGVAVFTPAAPDGARRLLQHRTGVSRCLSTWLPDVVALSADGRLYAGSGAASPACGPGTRIVRVDTVHSAAPAVSALGVRNTLAESRLGRLVELQLSDDGTRLLVRSDSVLAITDGDLRVLSTLQATGVTAAAWLRGPLAPARIAVADDAGITIYDPDRMLRLADIQVGPTRGPIVFLNRVDGVVVAAPIAGGFVVARVSVP
jgi:hypothetical protein